MKKLSSIFLIFVIAVSLCSCYDDREIDETAYIIALGIDKGESGGFSYTFQFSAPLATMDGEGSKGGAESKDGENPTVRNIVITAPDFYTAKNMTNNFLSKSVDMSHLKLIVFSAAVDSDGFLSHSQFLLREREIRPHTAVALARNSAEEYLKSVNPELEANTAKYYELMSLRSNNVYSPTKRLSDFVDEINSQGGVSVLPIACTDAEVRQSTFDGGTGALVGIEHSEIKSDKSELRGMAIFKNGEVRSLADGSSAMLFNILNRDIKNCMLTFKNPYKAEDFFTLRLNIPHPAEYLVDNTKKPCLILVSQGFNLEFFGGALPDGFSSHTQLYAYAKSAISDKLSHYFYDLSRAHHADIMKIGDCFKRNFLTNKQWDSFDWDSVFQTAEFEINIYFV